MQVIKADNAHLQQQLLEKDRILKEWLTTADTWVISIFTSNVTHIYFRKQPLLNYKKKTNNCAKQTNQSAKKCILM